MKSAAMWLTVALLTFSYCSACEVEESGQCQGQLKGKTTWELEATNPGVRATVAHQGTIVEKNDHRLDGGAFASKQLHPSGPLTVGGNLQYTHVPSGSNVGVAAQHTQHYGTDVKAQAVGNIWKEGNSRFDAVGSYERHYGGPQRTGRPNAYGGFQFQHRF